MAKKMKDSGIEWIGAIPEDWDLTKLKYHVKIENGSDSKTEGDIPVYGSGTKSFKTCGEYKVGPTVLLGHVGSLGIPYYIEGKYWNTGNTFNTIVDDEITLKYFYFLARCFDYKRYISQTAMPMIARTSYSNMFIPIPSLPDQQQIADYLDKKVKEIDTAIEKTKCTIDDYKKYKQSIITDAVTKGLDPDVEMKDSGVDWIGMIPAAWNMQKGKYLFARRSQRGNTIELQLLSPTQKYGVIPQTLYEELSGMKAVKLNEKADLSLLKTIHSGDYCISLRSFQGGFEYSTFEGVVSPAYQVFYPTAEIIDGYYKYLFKEPGFIEKMNSYTLTLRDGKNIAFTDFADTYIPYPQLKEQQEIVDYLDDKCSEIDKLIANKEAIVKELEAYKKSLVYEYVTGKKEVV